MDQEHGKLSLDSLNKHIILNPSTSFTMDIQPNSMCFGLSKDLDQASFFCFLKQIGREEFAKELASRASSEEIEVFVTEFTALMKKHFSENEYHRLFLGDESRPQHGSKINVL